MSKFRLFLTIACGSIFKLDVLVKQLKDLANFHQEPAQHIWNISKTKNIS